ncbi:MAG: DUF4160 domain-containing protein [Phycisphaerae bacterium]|nr:DUF4160 domain-containing protein [Phycisphaerae bacterium]
MPTIAMFYGIVIRMFFDEHAPPHFHAEYAEHKASIAIESLDVIEGQLPRRAINLVLDWAELHQQELRRDWELCRGHRQPLKIAPLK